MKQILGFSPSLRRVSSPSPLFRLLLAALCWNFSAEANEDKTSESRVEARPVLQPLRLRLEGDRELLSFDALRGELEKELARPVVASSSPAASPAFPEIILTLRGGERELAVTYTSVEQGTITRVVAAPEEEAERQRLLVLLISSLTRHEASQILPEPRSEAVKTAPEDPAEASSPEERAEEKEEEPRFLPANFSIFYPIAVNYFAPEVRTYFDLGLSFSRIGELDGVGIGGVQFASRSMSGAQISYAANIVTGPAKGAQISAGFNQASSLRGLQITGGLNWVTAQVHGSQIGLVNWANSGASDGEEEAQVSGAQIGLVSVGQKVSGAQIGLVNLSQELQGAGVGLINFTQNSSGKSAATQVGLINLNTAVGPESEPPNYQGPQIGLINIGGHVRGAQIGLINIAEDVEGASIGLLSLSKSGSVHPIAWSSTNTYANVGVKFANRYSYSILSVAAHPTSQQTLLGYGFTLGAIIPVLPGLFVEPDVGLLTAYDSSFLSSGDEPEARAPDHIRRREQYRLRVSLRYAVASHLSFFAGGGVVAQLRYEERGRQSDDFEYSTLPEGFAGIQF